MKDILTVMKFTMKEMIKRKSFIISTIIILLLEVIGFNVPKVISNIKGEETNAEGFEEKIIIVDNENIFEGKLEQINTLTEGQYKVTVGDYTFDDIKQKIKDDEIESAVIVEKDETGKIKLRYLIEEAGMFTSVPDYLMESMTKLYSNIKLEKLGITEEQIKDLNPEFEVSVEKTSDEEVHGNVFLMMIMSIVLFYAIYFCAYQVSTSITTEKTSKIMETLVTSTSPRTIVLGKTIGIGLVGLLQLVLLVAVAIVCAKTCLNPEMINAVLDMSNFTPLLAVITIVYFVLGYLLYSLVYALTGSTVSKPEDIQSANAPVAIIAIVGFYLSYFTMMNPASSLNQFAAIFPISAPFCMPFRVMMGLAETWEILVSILVLIVTILVVARVAIKIYSGAILNYGTKMSFKDILNIYKDKNN